MNFCLPPSFAASRRTLRSALSSGWLLPIAALLAAALLRNVVEQNSDVDGILTEVERALAGQRMYADFLEVNPPGALLIYVPPILLARWLGIEPDVAVNGLILASVVATLAIAGRVLAAGRLLPDKYRPWLAAGAIMVLAILPTRTFGEREHIGVIALLPFLALCATRESGSLKAIPWFAAIASGLGCGLALVAKPHFVLAVAPLALTAMLRARSIRPVFRSEYLVAVAMLGLYALSIPIFFPDFLNRALPMAIEVYVPIRQGLVAILLLPSTPIWLGLAVLCWAGVRTAGADAATRVLLTAAAGMTVAFLVQGKGWPYHIYPATAFMALAALRIDVAIRDAVPTAETGPATAWIRTAALLITLITSAQWFNWERDIHLPALRRMIEAEALRPTITVISPDVSVGYPLVRQLGGKWATRASVFITANVLRQLGAGVKDPKRVAALEAYASLERRLLVEDMVANRPEIVIVERGNGANLDWGKWIAKYPEVAAAFAPYHVVGRIDELEVRRLSP